MVRDSTMAEVTARRDDGSAIAVLRRELRLKAGPVAAPSDQDGEHRFTTSRDGFRLIVSPNLSFQYRRGRGVRYTAAGEIDAAAVETFHHGSVYGAVAWMLGLLPLHASAVLLDGRVHAFAGVSGEGKSTLVAALGARGLRRFADDILTVDTAPDGEPRALPGHKRLKLWADAMALTGQSGTQRVWPGVEKFYIEDADPPLAEAMPLASLTLLESGTTTADMTISQLSGAARLMTLRDHCYRPELREPERGPAVFAQIAAVAASVAVFRFSRPRDTARFASGVDMVIDHLQSLPA